MLLNIFIGDWYPVYFHRQDPGGAKWKNIDIPKELWIPYNRALEEFEKQQEKLDNFLKEMQ